MTSGSSETDETGERREPSEILFDLDFLLSGENMLDNRLFKDGLGTITLEEDVNDCVVVVVVVGVLQGEPEENILKFHEIEIFFTRVSFFDTLRGYLISHTVAHALDY